MELAIYVCALVWLFVSLVREIPEGPLTIKNVLICVAFALGFILLMWVRFKPA